MWDRFGAEIAQKSHRLLLMTRINFAFIIIKRHGITVLLRNHYANKLHADITQIHYASHYADHAIITQINYAIQVPRNFITLAQIKHIPFPLLLAASEIQVIPLWATC